MQDGLIGKVTFVRTWNYANIYPEGIGNPPDSDPPAGARLGHVAGSGAQGPVQLEPLRGGRPLVNLPLFLRLRQRLAGRLGVHLLDIVQWAMKVDGPNAVTASGAKFYLQDNSDTPDTLQMTFEYPTFVCHLRKPAVQRQFDVRPWIRHRIPRHRRNDVRRPRGIPGLSREPVWHAITRNARSMDWEEREVRGKTPECKWTR